MAEATARNLEGDQAEFEGQQLAALNALHAADPDVVDLAAVETAGVITAETRTKIEAAVPNHQLLFQRAVAKERREAVSSEVAYRRAFQAIYGRFLLEQGDSDMEKPNSPVMKALRQVLKFPLTAEGLKGRSELRAAVLRLKLAGLSGGNVEELIKEAFPGITIVGGTIKIHGFEASFTHVAKVLKAAQDYFESPEEMSALRDSYRDLSNLIKKSSNRAFIDELGSSDVGFKPEDFDKGIQAQINKLGAKIDAIKRSTIQDQRNATDQQRAANETLREARAEKVARLSEALRVLKDNLDASKRLHAEMQKLIKKLEVAMKAGVNVVVNGSSLPLSKIIDRFKKIDLRGTDFQPKQLLAVYKMLGGYFESDTNVAGFASEIEKAKKEVVSSTDLTDAAAAKKIIAVMVAKQFPGASLEEQQKIAAMVLAGDIATLQTDLGYSALGQRASAELLDTVSQAGFKEKLIGLRYKEGEKIEQPFKDLKPENFKDWASIEKLFTIGRLNHQNGFFVLAALEIFDGDVRSVQSVRTERKLKALIAEQLDVDERVDEAGVNKIVNDAFKDQMKKVYSGLSGFLKGFIAKFREIDSA